MAKDATELIWKLRGLTLSVRLTLLALGEHTNQERKDGRCWPGLELLTDETDVSRRSVIDSINFLEMRGRHGVLGIERGIGRGRLSIYEIDLERLKELAMAGKGVCDAPFCEICANKRCTGRREKVHQTTLKGAGIAEPPDPLKGVTGKNRKEPFPRSASRRERVSFTESGCRSLSEYWGITDLPPITVERFMELEWLDERSDEEARNVFARARKKLNDPPFHKFADILGLDQICELRELEHAELRGFLNGSGERTPAVGVALSVAADLQGRAGRAG